MFPGLVRLGMGAQAPFLCRRVGDFEFSATKNIGIDGFGCANVDDFIYGAVHGQLEIVDLLDRMRFEVVVRACGDGVGQPSAIAPGGSVANVAGFENRDIQVRIGLGQVVGGPQAGEPGSHDSDIHGAVPAKFRPGLWDADLFPPMRYLAIEHAWTT